MQHPCRRETGCPLSHLMCRPRVPPPTLCTAPSSPPPPAPPPLLRYQTDDTMARSPGRVMELLENVWGRAKVREGVAWKCVGQRSKGVTKLLENVWGTD